MAQMKIELIDDWKKVIAKAWSVRFGMLAGFFTALNALIELGGKTPSKYGSTPPKTLLVLAVLSGLAGFLSRFLKQPEMINAPDVQSEADQQA
jgi:hypothetical protein